MEERYITIQEAASAAGYRDPSVLHRAARTGKLRSREIGPRARVTTRAWLQEYLDSVKQRGTPQGHAKQGANGHDGDSAEGRAPELTRAEAEDLRFRLQAFAEDWDAPEMDVYNVLPAR